MLHARAALASLILLAGGLATACGSAAPAEAAGGTTTHQDAGGQIGNPDATSTTDAAAGDGSAATPSCIPGQSIGCVGPGGCATNQVCRSNGTGFGPCECAATSGDDTGDHDGGPFAVVLAAQVGQGLAAPLPDGSGITYDGQDLWLLAASGDPQPYTLVRFDAATSIIDRSFTLASLFETKGTLASGITWDGVSLWISVAGNTNQLLTVDPITGKITKTMPSPAWLGPVDLDFDGTDIWLSSGAGEVFRLATADASVLQQFAVTISSGRDHGIAFRPGQLFVGGLFGGMEVYSPSTGAPLGAAIQQNGVPLAGDEVGPSVFVGSELVMLSSLGITSYTTQ